MCFGPFKRICSWGPLTALVIIHIIIMTTIHCSRQWWKLYTNPSTDFSFMIFIILGGLTLYHFINSIYEGPGYLPLHWTPENEKDCEFLQFCNVCQGYKAPRSHHCRKCNRCVLKMDHHCPWINNCVGHFNHGYFTAFLISSVAGCCISSYIMIDWVIAIYSSKPMLFYPPSVFTLVTVLFSIGLSLGVIISVGILFYSQMTSIIKNQTGIECWILEKAAYRRSQSDEKFVNPYSKGWFFNIKQVLSWHCVAPGDGIVWPVIEGCDQYTLTREQLAQKQEKRKRARRYRVVARATGSWVPISHGIKVLCSLPITDEPRIKLDIGDTVIVTRWRKNWLFGEKECAILRTESKDSRIRGWFPRPCAIPLSEKDKEFYDYLEADQDTRCYENISVSASPSITKVSVEHKSKEVSSTAASKKKSK